MKVPRSRSDPRSVLADGPPVPRLSKLGGLVIAIGLITDVVEHAVVARGHAELAIGFSVGEHLAHLLVLLGMVIVLVGIVIDGTRTRRSSRQEGRALDAIR